MKGPLYFEPVCVGKAGQRWRALRGDAVAYAAAGPDAERKNLTIPEGALVEQREPGLVWRVAGDDLPDRRGRLLELSVAWLPVRVGSEEAYVIPDASAAGESVYFEEFKT